MPDNLTTEAAIANPPTDKPIKFRAPLGEDGAPILDAIPQGWDSTPSTWKMIQWIDIDMLFCNYVRCSQPAGGWTAENVKAFIEHDNAAHWGPPNFQEPIPPDVDWAIIAREFNSIGQGAQ